MPDVLIHNERIYLEPVPYTQQTGKSWTTRKQVRRYNQMKRDLAAHLQARLPHLVLSPPSETKAYRKWLKVQRQYRYSVEVDSFVKAINRGDNTNHQKGVEDALQLAGILQNDDLVIHNNSNKIIEVDEALRGYCITLTRYNPDEAHEPKEYA